MLATTSNITAWGKKPAKGCCSSSSSSALYHHQYGYSEIAKGLFFEPPSFPGLSWGAWAPFVGCPVAHSFCPVTPSMTMWPLRWSSTSGPSTWCCWSWICVCLPLSGIRLEQDNWSCLWRVLECKKGRFISFRIGFSIGRSPSTPLPSETQNNTYLTRKPAVVHDIQARYTAAEEEEEVQVRRTILNSHS